MFVHKRTRKKKKHGDPMLQKLRRVRDVDASLIVAACDVKGFQSTITGLRKPVAETGLGNSTTNLRVER